MYFDATPMNMTILLVVALAIIAIVLLSRGRYDSNLPLLYYSAALASERAYGPGSVPSSCSTPASPSP